MDGNLQKAKELLRANGYIVTKITDQMNKDADECVEMMENGQDKECFGCSCNICTFQ